MSMYPTSTKSLRACMICSIVLPNTTFVNQGCPNCEHFLELQGSSEAVHENTSSVYEGLITLADPTTSWVAKWQRLDSYVAGIYATKVEGILPPDSKAAAARAGVQYIPRDGSATEDSGEVDED
ncbi:putative transcriptional elongation protein Spt4 [Pseudovirgaria hyperparasitica]|uniref:Transcription elongation factor SPT4 n=1 Tax=Pseudovirgaria hyperparasitica TaxID=470096 RepID=A0A6A6VZN7_9PEZI|nr:putative transcriptional elongation protein Spt4 [Pseudovirgaria hyperparasitica]KAF2755349.1 putative transcriptional elongation protein Spt4 [Pseudovirgaria hyperparasitica]